MRNQIWNISKIERLLQSYSDDRMFLEALMSQNYPILSLTPEDIKDEKYVLNSNGFFFVCPAGIDIFHNGDIDPSCISSTSRGIAEKIHSHYAQVNYESNTPQTIGQTPTRFHGWRRDLEFKVAEIKNGHKAVQQLEDDPSLYPSGHIHY